LPFYSFATDIPKLNDEPTEVSVDLSRGEVQEVSVEQKEVVSELKDIDFNELSDKEIDKEVVSILQESYTTLPELIDEQLEEVKSDGVENVEIETTLPTKTYNISEDVSLTFDEEIIVLDILDVGDEQVAIGNEEDETFLNKILDFFVEPSYAASASKKKKASNIRHIYDTTISSWSLVTAFIEAEFTYNVDKKTCTAIRTANYIKVDNIAGILANVYGKASAVQKPSDSRRIAYQSGYASLGIVIKGHGIKLFERYLRVNVECNYKGEISRSSTLA